MLWGQALWKGDHSLFTKVRGWIAVSEWLVGVGVGVVYVMWYNLEISNAYLCLVGHCSMTSVPNGPRRTSPDLVGQVLVQSSLEPSADWTDQSMLQD